MLLLYYKSDAKMRSAIKLIALMRLFPEMLRSLRMIHIDLNSRFSKQLAKSIYAKPIIAI